MADKKAYFNKPQRLTQLIGANTTVIVAGRHTFSQTHRHKCALNNVRSKQLIFWAA